MRRPLQEVATHGTVVSASVMPMLRLAPVVRSDLVILARDLWIPLRLSRRTAKRSETFDPWGGERDR